MPILSANQGWFGIRIEGVPDFEVYSFSGREKVSEPYEFELELVSRDPNVDLVGLLNFPALLTIGDHSGGRRLVHGQIREARQMQSSNLRTHYRLILVPRLWFLSRNCNHRIFQNLSVPEIIEEVLKKQQFSAENYEMKMKESYESREYCVQYGESDLNFISRLCEEEGIYYYFDHNENGHILCFSDAPGGVDIPGESKLRFFPGSGQTAGSATIKRLDINHRVNSDKASYREWNFKKPSLDLEVSGNEDDQRKAPTPGGLNLETYQYPHLHQLRDSGEHYVDIQLKRQLTFAQWINGEGDVSRLIPAFSFTLFGHPSMKANGQWWLTEVHHFGEQPQVLEHEAPDRGFLYQSRFTAIPFDTRFVPEIKHTKNRVPGAQTAIVTGPDGEEIYPDKYGRVKVEFHWDRRDLKNAKSSCWVRVSHGWAGGLYGAMSIPRIGHEVVVSFLEGDPDRPLITGRVYHAENKVPYELPEHKTRTVFKSMSTPGEPGQPRGFNELRIEDKKGQEEIYVHGEKDFNAYIKNDWKEYILHNQHRTVNSSSFSRVNGEDHQSVYKPRKIELMEEDHLTVHTDSHTEIKGKWLGKAGDEIHLQSGGKVVVEAAMDLTIKAGNHFVRITPAGIFTSVPFFMGAGSPGKGSAAVPLLPKGASGVAKSKAPKDMVCSCRKAAGMPFVEIG